MNRLLRRPAALSLAVPRAVQAGERFEVAVRRADGRPLLGGTVELRRDTALTRTARQWGGAATAVSDRSTAVVARAALDATGRALLTVPDGEATVAGYLVQRDYTVRVRVRTASASDSEGTTVLRVSTAAGPPVRATDPSGDGTAGVALAVEDLAGRQLRPGTVVTGSVVATASSEVTAREVRVELVLDEHVPARPGEPLEEDRSATTVVATARPVGVLLLRPGTTRRWPFRLRAPDPLPAPSAETPEFVLRWVLRAVVDRPVRPDVTAVVELEGRTVR